LAPGEHLPPHLPCKYAFTICLLLCILPHLPSRVQQPPWIDKQLLCWCVILLSWGLRQRAERNVPEHPRLRYTTVTDQTNCNGFVAMSFWLLPQQSMYKAW
jgi:hypothetical protein